MTMAKAACPECGRMIDLGSGVKKGDWISCPYCQAADIEVIGLNPPLLDWAYEEPTVAACPPPWRRSWRRWWG